MASKTNSSVTIDPVVMKAGKRRAKIECRSFSSLVEYLLWKHCHDSGDFRDLTKAKASRKD